MSPLSTTGRTRAEGERDEMVQFNEIERLVQITEGPVDERLDLPRSAAAARHHEDWRRHAEIADALQEIEAGALLHVPVVDHRQDNVQQNQVELLLQQQDEGVVSRACCRELIRVTVLELGKECPQYADHDWLIVDDEDSLHHVRGRRSRKSKQSWKRQRKDNLSGATFEGCCAPVASGTRVRLR